MTVNEIKELCLTEKRIPFEYRKNKDSVSSFVDVIMSNNFIVTNKHVKQLIKIFTRRDEHFSVVKDVKYLGVENTYDIEVEDSHSYIANGIIAHNTCNLPNSVSEEEVSAIYMNAWKSGLKGITVYRDGCRSGVMVSAEKKEEEKPKEVIASAKRRPKSLDCKIFRFSNKGEKWVGVVGMMDGEPYEIFTGMLDKLNIPNWVEEGVIIKNYEMVKDSETGEEKRQSRYDLCYEDKDGYRVCLEGLSRTFNSEYWNYAKLISGLLRHHMSIEYVIKVISTLKLDSSTINTWKNGVIRTLRKFQNSKDDESAGGETCPQCGGRLVRDGGCIHCIDCGWSRCE